MTDISKLTMLFIIAILLCTGFNLDLGYKIMVAIFYIGGCAIKGSLNNKRKKNGFNIRK